MNTQEWLNHLISFDTTSRNSNLALISTVESWCQEQQLKAYVLPDETKTKANLLATIPAVDGSTQGGLVLTGHTDVVPVDGQTWATDPFQATALGDKVFGRGTADMKGFIAVMLALTPKFKAMKLAKPIHFSLTYDEEVGCLGAPFVVDFMRNSGLAPEACIVGEPTNMKPVIGYKGRLMYHCQFKGLAAHSSLANQGCNAIEFASRLICYIREMADGIKKQGPFDSDFDVPYTTVTVNIISGGAATNIIPANCDFYLEVRYLPDFSKERFSSQIENYIAQELLPEMQETHPAAAVLFELDSNAPGFNTTMESPIVGLVQAITGGHELTKVSYSTEAGIFHRGGIPSIICGPGSIEQAHKPNEFVTQEQLRLCETALLNIVQSFC